MVVVVFAIVVATVVVVSLVVVVVFIVVVVSVGTTHIPQDALHLSITNLFFVQYLGTNLAHFVLVSSQGSLVDGYPIVVVLSVDGYPWVLEGLLEVTVDVVVDIDVVVGVDVVVDIDVVVDEVVVVVSTSHNPQVFWHRLRK